MTTNWNQGEFYSQLTPECNSQNTPIGCAPIAIGQILKYYNYPNSVISYQGWEITKCFGSRSFEDLDLELITGNKNILAGTIPELLYDIAVITLSEFELGGTDTYLSRELEIPYLEYVFRNIFLFDNNVHTVYSYVTSGYREAWDLVKSNSTVQSNATTTFDSGNRIELNSGFEVQQGATFIAKIDGCDTNLNSLQENSSIEK